MGVQIVPINTFSDGDPSHVPKTAVYWKEDPPNLYLEKIAILWMQHRGESIAGKRYVLDRLPDGYSLWAKRRPSHEKVIDKWLFGHPKHKWFDSPNRFFPHFLHLMDHGTNSGCPCTVCATNGGKTPAVGANRLPNVPILGPKPKGRPRIHEPPSELDSEGTPDVYRTLLNRLERDRYVDVPIEEHMSLDWRVESQFLREMLDHIPNQPSWLPRLGELVLFLRKLDEPGTIQRKWTGETKIFNRIKKRWEGFPLWEAGVVTQVAEENLQIEELVEPSDKEHHVNYAGFRVEPISNPNSKSKLFSRRYKYVPLHHVRPFTFWAETLHNVPQDILHETIQHAKTLSSSLTLVGKYHFRGTWPSSDIFCKGIYIGSEIVVVGDTVRMLPTPGTAKVTDILKVTAIKLKFTNLDHASRNDQSDGHPYNSTVVIIGKAYTTDIRKAAPTASSIERGSGLIPADVHDCSIWYPLHASSQSMQVPFKRILGRCYSSKAMHLWFSSSEPDATDVVLRSMGLSSGLSGTLEAREFARRHDKRLSREGRNWLWADTRAEALDVESLNGVETAKHDESRDPRRWVRYIKELDGIAGPDDQAALIRAAEKSRRSFGGLASQTSFVQSALAPNSETTPDVDDEYDEDEDEEAIERASKRSRSTVVEIRESHTDAGQLHQDTDFDDFILGEDSLANTAEMVELKESNKRMEEVEDDDSYDEADDVVMLDKFQSRS